MSLRKFTRAELNCYNGKSGVPAYIAWCGKVYDLSSSYYWRGGTHWVHHAAGTDLTGELSQAPHNADLLARFPVVGILVTDEELTTGLISS